jgi:hypothetical protein
MRRILTMRIEDGKGRGSYVAVNERNELRTFSVTETKSQAANEDQAAYNLNTGEITGITSGNATLFYFYNDQDEDVFIDSVAFGFRGFTGLSDMVVVEFIRNPTAGDLISDATAISANANRNFGSARSFKATTLAYKGKDSGTITGGTTFSLFYAGNNTRTFATINILLPRGSSFAAKVTSDATAGTAYFAAIINSQLEGRSTSS